MTVIGMTVGILAGMGFRAAFGADHKMSLVDFIGFMLVYGLLTWVFQL